MLEKVTKKSPIYWERFRRIQARAQAEGVYCPKCDERRNLGKDVVAEVTSSAYRCKVCQALCEFRKTN